MSDIAKLDPARVRKFVDGFPASPDWQSLNCAELVQSARASGFGLHWEKLDADLSIPARVVGIFGSQSWMRELARRGGAATSVNKAAAARANGTKGGPPQKNGWPWERQLN